MPCRSGGTSPPTARPTWPPTSCSPPRRAAAAALSCGSTAGRPPRCRSARSRRSPRREACPSIAGLPLVRRPSGGGAIVHGSDLTYAAAVPKPSLGRPRRSRSTTPCTRRCGGALAELGIDAVLWRPTATARAGDPPATMPFFCFDRRAAGDLVVARRRAAADGPGHKIMGSAQRRLAATVLQHGSLLLAATRSRPGGQPPGPADLDRAAGFPTAASGRSSGAGSRPSRDGRVRESSRSRGDSEMRSREGEDHADRSRRSGGRGGAETAAAGIPTGPPCWSSAADRG